MENLLTWVDLKNNDLVIILSCTVVLSALFLLYQWYLNKKRFNQLDHDISADVVRRYLDSVIRNTEALKGSLFRGDVPVEATELKVTAVGGGAGADNSQFVEEIAKLKSTLEAREKELAAAKANAGSGDGGASSEDLSNANAEIDKLKQRNSELEEKLKDAASASGDAGADTQKVTQLETELTELKKEKDVLKERLQEYEIIEDDLANLKRLQQENEQLKKSLEGGAPAPTAAAAPAPAAEEAPAPKPAPAAVEEVAEATPEPEPAPEPEPKTEKVSLAKPTDEEDPDDLLKEFEKMLG